MWCSVKLRIRGRLGPSQNTPQELLVSKITQQLVFPAVGTEIVQMDIMQQLVWTAEQNVASLKDQL